jgi:hypothetical protein
MSAFLVALMFGIGIGAYAWTYLARNTGMPSGSGTIGGAAAAGFMAFIVLLLLLKTMFHL